MKKNVLFFTRNYPFAGGLERTITVVGKHLAERGYDVRVLALDSGGAPEGGDWLPYYTLPDAKNIASARNVEYFRALTDELETDVVVYHGLYPQLHPLMEKVARGRKFKLMTKHHNSPDACFKLLKQSFRLPSSTRTKTVIKRMLFPLYYIRRYRGYKKDYARVYRMSDRLILLSESYFRPFAEFGNITSTDKFMAMPNMLTFGGIGCHGAANRKVLYLGRLEYSSKRIDRLLHIWKQVQDRHPDWDLEIVGRGDHYDGLKKLADELKLRNFKINTTCTDIEAKLKESAILCQTSEYEGFPLVLTEAQQFGVVPIAYASYEAVHDIIEDGHNGYLVEPFEQAIFVEKLDRLMSDAGLRAEMAANAVESAARFGPEKIADRWEKLLNEA